MMTPGPLPPIATLLSTDLPGSQISGTQCDVLPRICPLRATHRPLWPDHQPEVPPVTSEFGAGERVTTPGSRMAHWRVLVSHGSLSSRMQIVRVQPDSRANPRGEMKEQARGYKAHVAKR